MVLCCSYVAAAKVFWLVARVLICSSKGFCVVFMLLCGFSGILRGGYGVAMQLKRVLCSSYVAM